MKIRCILLLFVLLHAAVVCGQWHVAPNGDDRGEGTVRSPFRSIQHAVDCARAGDTVWVHAGHYRISEPIRIPPKPTSAARCCFLWAAGDGVVVIDGSEMHHTTESEFKNGRCIYVGPWCNYWHFKGLTLCYAEDNGMKIEGSYHIVEQCVFHDNNDTGLQIGMGMPLREADVPRDFPAGEPRANPDYRFCRGNRVINCDAYHNIDRRRYDGTADDGGDADGFACKLYPGPDTEFYGCRAWENSDDNFDLYMVYHPVTIDRCWSCRAGYSPDGRPTGNGCGFKLGGGGSSGGARFPRSTGAHLIRNCIAFDNYSVGFDQNNAAEGMYLLHNTAWGNAYNYRFPTPLQDGVICLRNCVGFSARERNHEFQRPDADGRPVQLDAVSNSWTLLDGCHPCREGERNAVGIPQHTADYTAAFHSLSMSDFLAPRQTDGSLPNNGFARPKADSPLRERGERIEDFLLRPFVVLRDCAKRIQPESLTIPYTGCLPDLGARAMRDTEK